MIDVYSNRVPYGMLTDEEKQQIDAIPKEELIFTSAYTPAVWLSGAVGNVATTIYRRRPKPPLIVPDAVWAVLDKKFRWAAMDSDGFVSAFSNEPIVISGAESWGAGSRQPLNYLVGVEADPSRWRESLIQRPEGV